MQVASAPKMLCNNQGGHYVDFRYLVVDVTDEETYRSYVPEDARADYCRKVHAKYMIEEEASGHTKRLPFSVRNPPGVERCATFYLVPHEQPQCGVRGPGSTSGVD